MVEVLDAINRHVRLDEPPRRVVSLVPSETLSVVELAGLERLVGRTDYCVEPAGAVDDVPSVGGTKGFDVGAVKALRPDLVLANMEENSRPLVEGMIAAGLPVHVSFPRTVADSLAYLETLCGLLGVDADRSSTISGCRGAWSAAEGTTRSGMLPVFVPIWKDPWMTFDAGAYASDVLRVCGAQNVFAGRARRYPLAADLGRADPLSDDRVEGRDTRYPRIRLEEVVERGARAILLPNEPYAFGEEDAQYFRVLASTTPLEVELVDGKDLFWYGTHMAVALERLTASVASLRERAFGSPPNK